jgi:hypothetical protein
VRWVKVVVVVEAVDEAVVAGKAAVAGRAVALGWEAAPLLPAPAATVFAPTVGIRSHTWWRSPATRQSAPSAAPR